MATESDSGVKYKSITGQLKEHFEFRLSADSKTVILRILNPFESHLCCYDA